MSNTTIRTTPMEEVLKCMHAAFGLPTLTTALQKGHIHGIPGLTLARLKRYPNHSPATFNGQMAQAQQNQRSTKPKKADKQSTSEVKPVSAEAPTSNTRALSLAKPEAADKNTNTNTNIAQPVSTGAPTSDTRDLLFAKPEADNKNTNTNETQPVSTDTPMQSDTLALSFAKPEAADKKYNHKRSETGSADAPTRRDSTRWTLSFENNNKRS
jgi:hypothetical protein